MALSRVRPAKVADLPAIHTIWYQDEIADDPEPPAIGPVLSGFTYELEHGAMRVAEDDTGRLIGFGGSVTWEGPRASLTYLADLFIAQDAQAQGVGQAILRALPLQAGARCVHASTDPRATALYIRWGMLPLWPNLWLVGRGGRDQRAKATLPGGDVAMVEAEWDDRDLVAWDLRHFGFPRPRDLAWLVESRAAQPLWFRRAGATIGYGFVQRYSPESLWRPDAWTIGPVGAATPADARDCVCAATRWASERGAAIRLGVPGPHPALAPLIEAGFRIVYNETFLASPDAPLPDMTHYLPSGVFL